jgi:FAD/FMN-containing dehydrogenase
MAQLQTRDVAFLRGSFAGKLISPADADYAQACSVWNGDIKRRPALIARCSSAAGVAAAIGFAKAHGLEISVRGGGHNYAGFAIVDDGLMIDLSEMKSVRVDAANRRAVCGGGATWGDVDAATQEHALAVPGGFISHTGIGGLTLGGGIGWLTNRAGLSADSIDAAEVVTADGRIVRASAGENADLHWALKGGGGNFGVVTSFEYRLHPVGPMVHLAVFFWSLDKGKEALRFCRDFVNALPEGMGVFVAGLNAPPAPFVPPQFHGAPGYALAVVGFETPEQHAQTIAPVQQSMPGTWELVTPIPYAGLQQMFNESAPWGALAYEKALYLDELSDGVIDVLTKHMPQKQSPLSFVPIFALGGAYARVADDATAFGGKRSSRFVFNISAAALTPEQFAADRAWVRAFWDDLRPLSDSSGSYVNFMAEYEEDRVRAAYGAAKYDRLARIKAKWDPENLFHLNANIKPAP